MFNVSRSLLFLFYVNLSINYFLMLSNILISCEMHVLKMIISVTGARRDSVEDDDSLEDISFDFAMSNLFAGM